MNADPALHRGDSAATRFAHVVIVVMVSCAAIAFNQSAIHWRENIADDHLYAYGGWRLLHGSRPYLDVWDNKPPGIWWLNALAFACFGEGINGEIVLCSVAILVCIASFTGAAVSLLGPSYRWLALFFACVLLTQQRFECGANRTETYVCAAEALAVATYLRWLAQRRAGWLLLAFVAAGTAPWFKQSGFAAAAACGIDLAWRLARRRERDRLVIAAVALAGIALPSLAGGAVLSIRGAAGAAWNAIYGFNKLFFVVHDATWTGMDRVLPLYVPHLRVLATLIALAGLGLVWAIVETAAARRRRRPPPPPTGGLVIALWLVLSFYLACVGSGRQAYHLAPILAPLGLAALFGLREIIGRGDLTARVVASPLRLSFVAVCAVALARIGEDSLHYAENAWSTKTAWHSLDRKDSTDFELQAAALREFTGPLDQVYVWGWDPGAYRFAYRQCPSRFATIEHVSHVAPYGQFIVEGAMADIRQNPPAAMMISTADWQNLAGENTEFYRWIRSRYELNGEVRGMQLLLRGGSGGDRSRQNPYNRP